MQSMAKQCENSSESFLLSRNDKNHVGEALHSSTPLPAPLTPISRILMARQVENVYEANGSSILTPFSPVSVEKVNDLEQKVDALKKDNSLLRAEVQLEQEAKFQLEKENEKHENELLALRRSQNKYKEEIVKLRAECDEKCNVEVEVVELRQKNKDLQTRFNALALKLDETRANLATGEDEKQNLMSQMRQYKVEQSQSKSQIESLRSNLEELQTVFTQQSQEAAVASEKLVAATEEIKCLKDENDVLEARRNTICTKEHFEAESINQFQGESMSVITEFKLRELDEHVKDLKSTWTSPASSRTLQGRYKRVTEDLEKNQKYLDSLQQERRELNAKLDEEKVSASNYQKKLEMAERKIGSLEKKAQKLSLVQQVNSELSEKLKDNEKERSKVNDELSVLEKLHKTVKAQKSNVVTKLEKSLQDVAAKEKKIEFLVEKLEFLKSELNQVQLEIADFNSKLDKAAAKLCHLQDGNHTLRAQKDDLTKELSKVTGELEQEKIEKEKSLFEFRTTQKEMEELEEKTKALGLQFAAANEQVMRLESERGNFLRKLETSEKSEKELQEILSDLRSERDSLQADVCTKTLKMEDLARIQSEHSVLVEQRVELENALLIAKEKLKQGNEEKEELATKLRSCDIEMKDLKQQYKALESQTVATNAEKADLIKRNADLSDELKGSKASFETQQEEITTLQYCRDDALLKLEAATSHFNEEKAIIQTQCSGLKKELDELTEQKRKYEIQSNALQDACDQLKSNFGKALSVLTQQMGSENATKQSLNLSHDEDLKQNLDVLVEAISKLKQSSKALSLENEKLRENIALDNASVLELRNKIDILQSAADAELKIRSANLSEIEKLKDANLGLSSQLKSAHEKFLQAEENLLQLQSNQEANSMQWNTKSSQIEILSADIVRLNTERNDCQARLNESEQELLLLKTKYEQQQTIPKVTMEAFTSKKEECVKLKAELQAEQHEMSEMKGDIEALQSQLEFSANQLKSKSDEIEKLSTENNVLTEDNLTSQAKLLETELKYTTLKDDLENLQSKYDETRSELSHKCEENESLKADLQSNQLEVSEMKNNVKFMQAKLDNSTNELSSKTNGISELSAKLAELDSQFVAAEARLMEFDKKQTELRNDKENLQSKYEETRSELSHKCEENESLKSDLQSNQLEVSEMKSNVKIMQAELDNSANELSSKSNKISELSAKLAELNSQFVAAEARLMEFDKKQTELRNDKENLQSKCEETRSELSHKCEENESLKSDLKSNQLEMSEMKNNVKFMQAKLENSANELSSKSNKISELSAKLAELDSGFVAAEARLMEFDKKQSELRNDKEQLETENESIKLELSKIKKEFEVEVQSEREEKSHLQASIELLKSRLLKADEVSESQAIFVKKLSKENTELGSKIITHQRRYEESQRKCAGLDSTLDSLREDYKKLSSDFQNTILTIEESAKEHQCVVEEKDSEIRDLTIKNGELHKTWGMKAKSFIDELANEKEKYFTLTTQYNDLMKGAQELNNEKLNWQKQLRHSRLQAETTNQLLKAKMEELRLCKSQLLEAQMEVNSRTWTYDSDATPTLRSPLVRSKSQELFKSPLPKYIGDSLNDSLDFLQKSSRNEAYETDTTISADAASNAFHSSSHLSKSCASVESSMLNEHNDDVHFYSTGDLSRDGDTLFGKSQRENAERMRRATMGPSDLKAKSSSVARPSLIEFRRMMEEPDNPNYDRTSSLHRVAELQQRNSKQLAHLKSSYPIETQGQTPSKCDETVRLGDSRTTLRRISKIHESLQAPPPDVDQRTSFRGLPGYRSSSNLDVEQPQHHGIKRSHLPSSYHDAHLSSKTRRETICGIPFGSHANASSLECDKENPTKKSTKFDVLFTPPAFKRNKVNKNAQPPSNITTRSKSKDVSRIEGAPEPSTTRKERGGSSVKKTPSLMNRMRRPLGKLNLKKSN